MVGISPEGSVFPGSVLRIRIGPPSAAELGVVGVKDTDSFETGSKIWPVEVRISAGAWETSDVDQGFDRVC